VWHDLAFKSPFSVPLVCTGARRNPATCGTNQKARKRRFGPARHDLARAHCEYPLSSHSATDLKSASQNLALESVTLSERTPPCPYGIAYRRSYGLSFRWTVPFSLVSEKGVLPYSSRRREYRHVLQDDVSETDCTLGALTRFPLLLKLTEVPLFLL
jgi:hypothetical protein